MKKITYQWFPLLLVVITGPINCLCTSLSSITQLYVVPFESLTTNEGNGSLTRPYSSIQQALDHIERVCYPGISKTEKVTINLYPTYHFVDTIRFRQIHSHIRLTTMTDSDVNYYEKFAMKEQNHRRLSTARISGGILLTNWTLVGNNTYSTIVSPSLFVNQLFINNQRIVRTRVPTNFSDYLHYVAPLNDSIMARYGFQYAPGQFDYKSLADAMVVIYHSYTESHHYIDKIITSNNTILFTNPSGSPIEPANVETQQRFHIENLCEALVPNSFCFVNETKTVYLMTNGSYNPMEVEIITPVNTTVVSIDSDDASKPVEDIIIDNLAIQHGAWMIGRTQQGEGMWSAYFPYAALSIRNARSITISNVEISHTGTYGLQIKQGTSDVNMINSIITDTGAGGIWMGDWATSVPLVAISNKIISNEISYGGNVFPSAVGVLVLCAFDIVIADNIIHHHRYNGISLGAQNDYQPSLTANILVLQNYIYSIGQHILCDQGGIYMIGVQTGTFIHGNVIKNVFSYSMLMWGIYLDNCASNIVVSNNVVYNTGWAAMFQHIGANNTVINNVFARASLIEPPQPGDPAPDGDVRIQAAENHTSWIYTRNIVYDTFQRANHSAVTLSPNVIASFNNNVYYNPYGTSLTFGSGKTSFSDWQKTGQDNSSVIADPLFLGDVNQCDFFTVQPNSPAAKLGFVNITKPSKWTPGCNMDDTNKEKQFYHW